MNSGFVIVKSLEPPESVTDALEFSNDIQFKAQDYRALAACFCTHLAWTGDAGVAEILGTPVSLESTDAALFLTFSQSDVPPRTLEWVVARAMEGGALVMRAESAEILSRSPST